MGESLPRVPPYFSMPFKSKAQKNKFQMMVAKGEISPEVYKEWESKTPKKLPERVGKTPSIKKAKVIK
jgi:hypothetical protein